MASMRLSQNCLFFNVKNTQTLSWIIENITLKLWTAVNVMCFYEYFWCLLTETSGSYSDPDLSNCCLEVLWPNRVIIAQSMTKSHSPWNSYSPALNVSGNSDGVLIAPDHLWLWFFVSTIILLWSATSHLCHF